MKSIIQKNKECWFCKSTYNLDRHHICYGTANRKISEKHGFVVYLCKFHHTGDYGVHGKYGKDKDIELKQTLQKKYEENHTREEFISLIGQSFIREEENE